MTAENTLIVPTGAAGATPVTQKAIAVTVFSKNDCSDCTALKKQFTRKGVPYTEINVQEDQEPRAEFGGLTPMEHVVMNYGRQMPAVVVTDDEWGDWWTGSRIDKILETIKRFRDADLLIPEEQRVMR